MINEIHADYMPCIEYSEILVEIDEATKAIWDDLKTLINNNPRDTLKNLFLKTGLGQTNNMYLCLTLLKSAGFVKFYYHKVSGIRFYEAVWKIPKSLTIEAAKKTQPIMIWFKYPEGNVNE